MYNEQHVKEFITELRRRWFRVLQLRHALDFIRHSRALPTKVEASFFERHPQLIAYTVISYQYTLQTLHLLFCDKGSHLNLWNFMQSFESGNSLDALNLTPDVRKSWKALRRSVSGEVQDLRHHQRFSELLSEETADAPLFELAKMEKLFAVAERILGDLAFIYLESDWSKDVQKQEVTFIRTLAELEADQDRRFREGDKMTTE